MVLTFFSLVLAGKKFIRTKGIEQGATGSLFLSTKKNQMAIPCATLTYFGGRGLGERARWCLAAAKIPFENNVLTTREEMVQLIEGGDLQFHQLPLLQFPGSDLKLVQSKSICRYIARNYGLQGETVDEEAKCDMLAEYALDFGAVIGFPFQSPDKVEQWKLDMKSTFDKKAPMLETALEQGFSLFLLKSDSGYDKVRYSDLFVAEAMTWFIEIYGTDLLDQYPNIRKLQSIVVELPQMKEYLLSSKRFGFPVGDVGDQYVANVNLVLGR